MKEVKISTSVTPMRSLAPQRRKNFDPPKFPPSLATLSLENRRKGRLLISMHLQNLNDKKQKELDSKDDNGDKVHRMTFIPEKLEERASFEKLEGKLRIFEGKSLSRAEIC